jgi:outer membrane translocation and assembly module TamA
MYTKNIVLLIAFLFLNIHFLYSSNNINSVNPVKKEILIEILGNDILDKETLEIELGIDSNLFNLYKIFKASKINIQDINVFKESILGVYKENGFLDTKIKIIKTKQKVIYNIQEGKSLIFKNFIINNKIKGINVYKMLNINLGERFNSNKISKLKDDINYKLLSLNYPLPNFKLNVVLNEEDTTLTMNINIPDNKKYIIKTINIYNDTNIDNGYILEKIQLNEGKYYKYIDEKITLENLKKLNMFQNIRVQKKLNGSDLIVNIYINHILNNKYKASLGFDTDEFIKGKIFFKNSNFFNTYGNITTNIKASQVNQYLFSKYNNHYSTKTTYFINTLLEHKQNSKFEFITYNLENGIKYDFIGDNYFIIRYSKNNIIYDFIKNQKTNYDINSLIYKFELKTTRTDELGFNIEEGEKFNFYIEKSFYSNIDFVKVKSNLLKLKDFMGNKFLLKLKYYFIKELKSNSLPTPLLFPVGGMLSNRGIDYEYTYTDNLFENTMEVHTKVRKDLFIATFEDYSYFKNIQTNKYESVFSIGAGLRFKTKIGVFKLDIAKKVNDFENSTYKFNFGYGYDF